MRNKLISVLAGASLVLGLATGCQASPPDISDETAAQFQSRVLAVSTAVADGGYAAALDALTALQAELDAAAADGSLSFARHQRIEAAMALVRADIQAAIDAQAVPTPAPTPTEPEETTAPVEQQPTPDVETDAEKKAREAAEKAAEKAAEDAAKKAEQEAQKAADEAKKKAEEDARKSTETPPATEQPQGKKGDG